MATNTGGSLYFEGGIDTQKLFDDVEKINTQIKGMADNTVSQGQRMDSAMNLFSQNMAGSLKESIQRQKQIIVAIESDIDRLQKKLAQPETFGRIRNDAVLDLNSAKKVLAEEQAILNEMQNKAKPVYDENAKTIANLTARIKELTEAQKNMVIGSAEFKKTSEDLKKANDELKTATKDAQPKEVPNPVLESIKRWALGIASVTGALEIGKKIIESTKDSSDKFHFAISAAQSGLDYFWKTLATGDWNNFLSNFDKAISVGWQYAEMMDKVKEANRALSIAEAYSRGDALKLEEDLRNKGLSDEKRVEAGEKRLELEEKLTQKRVFVAKKAYDADMLVATNRSKLSEETLRTIISDMDSETKARAEHYNEQLAEAKQYQDRYKSQMGQGNLFGAQITADQIKKLPDLSKVPESVKLYAQALRGEGELTDEMLDNVVKSTVELINATNSGLENTKRVRTMINSEKEAVRKEKEEAAKKVTEEKNKFLKDQNDYATEIGRQRIENQLKIDQQVIDAQKDGADKQRKQAELDYKQNFFELTKQYEDQLKKYNELNGGIDKKTGQKTSKYVSELPKEDLAQYDNLVENARKVRDKKIEDIDKKSAEELKKIASEITAYSLSEAQKEIAAINEKYDKLKERAIQNGADQKLLAELEKNRLSEIDLAYKDITQKVTDYYKRAFGDLSELGYQALRKLQNETKAILDSGKLTNKNGKTNYIVDIPDLDAEGNAIKKTVSLSVEEFTTLQKKYTELTKLVKGKNIFKDLMEGVKKGDMKDISTVFADVSDVVGQLGDVLNQTDIKYGVTVDNVKEYLNGAASLAKGLATGDPMAIIQGVISLADSTFKMLSHETKGAEMYAEQLKIINDLLEKQQRIVDQSARKGSESEAYQKQIELLKEQKNTLEKAIKAEENKTGSFLGIVKWDATSNKKIEEIKKQIQEVEKTIEDTQQAWDDFVAGGVTENTIADAIAQGFKDGKTSVNDFGQYVNNILSDAVLNVFKAEILGPAMTKVTEFIQKSLSDNILSPEEVAKVKKMSQDIVDANKSLWNDLTGALDMTGGKESTSLAGRVQQAITEDTATEFVGTWNRMSLDLRENVNTSKLAITHLVQIAANTLRTANNTEELSRLANMENSLRNLESSFNRIPSIRDLRS